MKKESARKKQMMKVKKAVRSDMLQDKKVVKQMKKDVKGKIGG